MNNNLKRLINGLGAGAILIFFLGYPLTTLFLQILFPKAFAAHPQWIPSLSVFRSLLHNPLTLPALMNTTVLAFTVSTLATLLGSLLAIILHKMRPHIPELWSMLMWILFLAPTFVISEGYALWGMPNGLATRIMGLPPTGVPGLFTPYGVIWVLTIKLLPIAMMTVDAALRSMGDEWLDAAKTLGMTRTKRFFYVLFPILKPALFASFFIIFAEAAGDFGVAATLAYNAHWILLSYLIFQALNTFPTNFGLAAMQALILVLTVASAQLLERMTSRRARFTLVHDQRHLHPVKRKSVLATGIMAMFFALSLGLPLLSYLWVALIPSLGMSGLGTISSANFAAALHTSQLIGSLVRSISYSLFTSLITVGLGLFLTVLSHKSISKWVTRWLTITVAIPGLVLAISYIFAWNAPWMHQIGFTIYGTPTILILAYTATSLPFVVRLLQAAHSQLAPNLGHAGRTLGLSSLRILFKITWPLILPTVSATLMLVTTTSLFELPASELLYPPGQPTLAVEILHQFNNFNYGVGSALTLMGMALALAVAMLWRLLEFRVDNHWQHTHKIGDGVTDELTNIQSL